MKEESWEGSWGPAPWAPVRSRRRRRENRARAIQGRREKAECFWTECIPDYRSPQCQEADSDRQRCKVKIQTGPRSSTKKKIFNKDRKMEQHPRISNIGARMIKETTLESHPSSRSMLRKNHPEAALHRRGPSSSETGMVSASQSSSRRGPHPNVLASGEDPKTRKGYAARTTIKPIRHQSSLRATRKGWKYTATMDSQNDLGIVIQPESKIMSHQGSKFWNATTPTADEGSSQGSTVEIEGARDANSGIVGSGFRGTVDQSGLGIRNGLIRWRVWCLRWTLVCPGAEFCCVRFLLKDRCWLLLLATDAVLLFLWLIMADWRRSQEMLFCPFLSGVVSNDWSPVNQLCCSCIMVPVQIGSCSSSPVFLIIKLIFCPAGGVGRHQRRWPVPGLWKIDTVLVAGDVAQFGLKESDELRLDAVAKGDGMVAGLLVVVIADLVMTMHVFDVNVTYQKTGFDVNAAVLDVFPALGQCFRF
ncbi:hypothetical protein Nepgr_023039 [Nepenthes gracilis]|uniref:Uncharacterized protein n=1 Tax=Nepenthes gracilis TaxID=150966 RepID=A0AAD3T352_NEPGR|nr:hypothetical protein Nepgr_023039 [Nepenthes gracilis]